jgi:hypothetical protein
VQSFWPRVKWPNGGRIVRAGCPAPQGKVRRQKLRAAITREFRVTYMRSKHLIILMAF